MKYVDLRNKNLTSLPNDIDIDVEYLDLSFNCLSTLPETFELFQKLKILFFSNNNFVKIPNVISKLKNVEMISFRNNHLIEVDNIPNTIRWLILTSNHIKHIKSFGHLYELRKLMLSGNLLNSLPNDIINCQNLELIRLSNNKFEEVPKCIFKLNNLAWISMANNPCFPLPNLPDNINFLDKNNVEYKEKIGEGTSGLVYKSTYNNSDVAMKIYKNIMTSDGLATNEIYILSFLKPHNNLINIIGLLYEQDKLNIQGMIMKLFNNYKQLGNPPTFKTITRDVYENNSEIYTNNNIYLFNQIECAVNYLHQNNIIHGDLYAHNIIYNKLNDHPVLTDFGASFVILDKELLNEFIKIEKRALNILNNELFYTFAHLKRRFFNKLNDLKTI